MDRRNFIKQSASLVGSAVVAPYAPTHMLPVRTTKWMMARTPGKSEMFATNLSDLIRHELSQDSLAHRIFAVTPVPSGDSNGQA
jgi:hypothetical protein